MLNIYLREHGEDTMVGQSIFPFDEYHKLFPMIDDYLHNTLGIKQVFYYRVHAIPYEYRAIIDFGEHHRFIVIKEVDEKWD